MFKKSSIGDSVAAEMDRILGDSQFQSVFSKPELTDEYSQALAQDAGYKAFVRVASKKDKDEDDKDKKEVGKDDEDKRSKARPTGKDKDKDKKKDKEKAAALEYIVEHLNKTSEALDNMGFDKSATVALALINGIYTEAVEKFADDSMEGRVNELQGKSPEELVDEDGEEEWPSTIKEPTPPKGLPEDPMSPAEEEPSEAIPADIESLFAVDDEGDCGQCGDVPVVTAAAKEKAPEAEALAFAKKCLKDCECKGTAKKVEKGIEVKCKGEKANCSKCEKEIKAKCKSLKVPCKVEKEVVVPNKKAFVIKNKDVLAALREVSDWVKEG